jgi:hypothetical protein
MTDQAHMQFDVPGWLASVVGCAREEIAFDSEREVGGVLTLHYTRDGQPLATVDLAALPLSDARRGAWQLFAQLGERVERVQVPAKTRFIWR